jgi:hypothetical protein
MSVYPYTQNDLHHVFQKGLFVQMLIMNVYFKEFIQYFWRGVLALSAIEFKGLYSVVLMVILVFYLSTTP